MIQSSDRKGLVYKVTECLFRHDLNIVANGEFVEHDTGRFFMRTELEGDVDQDTLHRELKSVLPEEATLKLETPRPKKIVAMVTKEPHCIGDILVRCQYDEMNAELLAVVGNNERLRPLVEQAGFPFHYVPHQDKSREEHEDEVIDIVESYSPDYVVLAKYMRILTPKMVNKFHHRMVNIHHSFLPAFIGANPYRQAYERGVKIIGATAHFVTDNLDEGPIIAQDVTRVEHHLSATKMAQAGRNVEKHVLNRALYLVFEDRVFISGNRTIIFE
jgi:formyltetrahydrofolate deformylase